MPRPEVSTPVLYTDHNGELCLYYTVGDRPIKVNLIELPKLLDSREKLLSQVRSIKGLLPFPPGTYTKDSETP